MLGVHPNTVRTWSDAGRLRYYRINPRGDRRYRMGDLQRFLAAALGTGLRRPTPSTATARRASRSQPHRPIDGLPAAAASRSGAEPFAAAWERGPRDGPVVADLAALAARAVDPDAPTLDELLGAAMRSVSDGLGCPLAVLWQLEGERVVPRAAAGAGARRLIPRRAIEGTVGRALADPARPATATVDPAPGRPAVIGQAPEVAVPIDVRGDRWGALLLAGAGAQRAGQAAVTVARALGALVEVTDGAASMTRQVHQAEALGRATADLSRRLELREIVAGIVDHARALFAADRAAVILDGPDGTGMPVAARGLSSHFLARLGQPSPGSVPAAALASRRPLFSVAHRDDPRAAADRAAIVREGYDTICAAPLFVGSETLGMVIVYHDQPHHWPADELDALATVAAQASVAIRTARNYSQMSTWTAQLQSIQQLGTRLNRLTTVREIGLTIANELRQLIDYHNVRVYRQHGDRLVPVAMQGQVGQYVDETPEQLAVAVGEGITGWVAQHRLPQSLPDAARDPRSNTVPGTEDDLDESMLLAPMIFEDEVLGVLVLSKLGLGQFSEDDLRLLVIYASFAAQAMANADATDRLRRQSETLERQLRSQRDLLLITESILTTLDPRAVLDQIADRLAELVGYDNISIEVYDRAERVVRPLTARGVNADEYLRAWEVGETGLATWVIEHNEGVLVLDQYEDPRVRPFSSGPVHGGLIVVPLRRREGVAGVLTVERLGEGNTFSVEEFELVELFAAQVSIALHNAEEHQAVEIRATTDHLTGLLNHGTFGEWLASSVARGEMFSLVMIDLDDFKAVNDALGHQAGDRLLAEIGQAISRARRESDHVFRYGGDEFTVLLPGADPAAAVAVTERIRDAVHAVGAAGTSWATGGVHVSASLGVATYPADGLTPESILLAADRASFVAKRAGSGGVATAEEGLALAGGLELQEPTPVDPPSVPDGD